MKVAIASKLQPSQEVRCNQIKACHHRGRGRELESLSTGVDTTLNWGDCVPWRLFAVWGWMFLGRWRRLGAKGWRAADIVKALRLEFSRWKLDFVSKAYFLPSVVLPKLSSKSLPIEIASFGLWLAKIMRTFPNSGGWMRSEKGQNAAKLQEFGNARKILPKLA